MAKEKENLDIVIVFRVSRSEIDSIRAAAESEERSISQFVRSRLLARLPKKGRAKGKETRK